MDINKIQKVFINLANKEYEMKHRKEENKRLEIEKRDEELKKERLENEKHRIMFNAKANTDVTENDWRYYKYDYLQSFQMGYRGLNLINYVRREIDSRRSRYDSKC